jgi:aryl-alcohol dehydrogenase-like predicted oxidoreductase
MTEPPAIRRLGASGLAVSVVGLGTNNFGMKLDLAQCRAVVDAAIDQGITLFDTADSYGDSEERLGELLQGRRDDVVIATKFGSDVRRRGQDNGADWGARGSRRYIRRAVEGSLRRLRTDWIDLYQLHLPDPQTPIGETLSALDDLVHEGKVRYLGHSNFKGWQAADAEWVARSQHLTPFISAQNEYNLLRRGVEVDLVPALEHYGIGLLPYFPLSSGLLTGKYRRGEGAPDGSRVQSWGMEAVLTDRIYDRLEALERFAAERGVTLLDVAIGGLAAQRSVASVIAGATTAEQVAANVVAGAWRPSAEDLVELDRVTGA